jgi:hypothetical protein
MTKVLACMKYAIAVGASTIVGNTFARAVSCQSFVAIGATASPRYGAMTSVFG